MPAPGRCSGKRRRDLRQGTGRVRAVRCRERDWRRSSGSVAAAAPPRLPRSSQARHPRDCEIRRVPRCRTDRKRRAGCRTDPCVDACSRHHDGWRDQGARARLGAARPGDLDERDRRRERVADLVSAADHRACGACDGCEYDPRTEPREHSNHGSPQPHSPQIGAVPENLEPRAAATQCLHLRQTAIGAFAGRTRLVVHADLPC